MTVSSAIEGWGPDRRPAAVSITFDNLGEAADIEFGQWPVEQAVGQHFTAIETVPALLETLGNLPATFYVETSNVALYPDLLRKVAGMGHEIGVHGWRHELWHLVPEPERDALLGRCVKALAEIDLRPAGFRPPGGETTPDLPDLLRKYGFTYHSAVGSEVTSQDGIVSLPFLWPNIDGYQLEPAMGGPAVDGESEDQACARLLDAFTTRVAEAVSSNKHLMLIFHPWIIGKSQQRMDTARALLREIAKRQDIWIATGSQVAAAVAAHRTHLAPA